MGLSWTMTDIRNYLTPKCCEWPIRFKYPSEPCNKKWLSNDICIKGPLIGSEILTTLSWVFYCNVGQRFPATLFISLSTSIESLQQPLMSSSITRETRWQKPCQEDLKRITTRLRSMSPATVSMPGLLPCHTQSSCPQDWKTGRRQLLSSYPPSVCRRAWVASARGSVGHLDIWKSQGAGP